MHQTHHRADGQRRRIGQAAILMIALTRTAVAAQVRSLAAAPPLAAPPAVPLVLDHVTVIDVEYGARLRDQRVVVVGNRIRALGSPRFVAVPQGARVVNARGKYLIPGLWDMHVHPLVDRPLEGGPLDGLLYPHNYSLDTTYHQANAVYYQLIANGVTGIRDAGSRAPLNILQLWKREIATGRRVGPRMIVSAQSIDEDQVDRPCKTPPATHHICVANADAARQVVDSFRAAGADMIKTYNLSIPTYFAIAAEARRLGMPFGGHLPDELDPLVASDSGALFLDHDAVYWGPSCRIMENGDSAAVLAQCSAAAARLRRNNTWTASFQVGIGGPEGSKSDSTRQFVRRALRYGGPANEPGLPKRGDTRWWAPLSAAERRQLPSSSRDWIATYSDSALRGPGCRRARLAYAADMPSVPGLDWPFGPLGVGVHLYLLQPVLCGVPPLWALQTATLNPARALHLTDSLGTVAVGKVADLVLLDGDPLEDIWNVSKICAVVANGRYFDRAALDRLLVAATAEWHTVAEITRQLQKQEEVEEQKEKGAQSAKAP